MTILEFLFYCLYRFFRFFPRREPIDHKLASSMLSLGIWLNLMTAAILIKFFIFPLSIINRYIYTLGFIIIISFCHFGCKNYFIKSGNYRKIIAHYDEKYNSLFKLMGIIGISYYLLSSFIFGWLAYYLSNRY
jgi:hypothetical protein